MHGSVQEAKHVIIEHRLKHVFTQIEKVHVLEIGFGTGLNALLSALFAQENQLLLSYVGLEAFPVEEQIWTALSYSSSKEEQTYYKELMRSKWGDPQEFNTFFTLTKIAVKIQEWQSDEKFDLIYFDAFGPNAQADMWQLSIFERLYASLNQGGVLVTYCAQGQFKRDLKSVGFSLEALPGPPGKREMTRAIKN